MTFKPDLDLGDSRRIIAKCKAEGLDTAKTAYVLATAYHETAHTMKPVREALADSDRQAVARLENAWQRGRLSWVRKPYWRFDAEGKAWFGRGYVQITWKRNYKTLGRTLGLDLVSDPSVVMDPGTAAAILVIGCRDGLFTGKALEDYITPEKTDFVGARRVVNGTDRAHEIAVYARDYLAALAAEPVIRPTPKAKLPGIGSAIRREARGVAAGVARAAIMRGLSGLFRWRR